MTTNENTTGDARTGPVYGAPGSGGDAPAPPPPPPGYAAPDYSEYVEYPPLIPGQILDDAPEPPGASEQSRQSQRPQQGTSVGTSIPLSRKETNEWAAGAHAGGLLAWIPVAPLIPAVAIYAVYKDRSPYIREQAREAINFQICVLIAYVAATLIDALPLLDHFALLVAVVSAVFALIASVAALRGKDFAYPYSRRFFKG